MKNTSLVLVVCLVCLLLGLGLGQQVLAQSPLETVLYFPQWADGGGYSSQVFVANLTGGDGQVVVRFYNSAGQEVAVPTDRGTSPLTLPLSVGVLTFSTRGQAVAVSAGWCSVAANVRIVGKMLYTFPDGQTTVLPSPSRRGMTLFAEFRRGVRNTGIAFANPNHGSSYIDLVLRDQQGAQVEKKRVTLPPLGHLARFIDEPDLFASSLASRSEFLGSIEVVAEQYVAATSLGFSFFSGGRFWMDNSPPLAQPYPRAALSAQVIAFIPSDVPVDPDYLAGVRFIASENQKWFQIEADRAGEGDMQAIEFPLAEDGQIQVNLVRGKRTSAEYEARFTGSGSELISSELYEFYRSGVLLVIHQANQGASGIGSHGRVTMSFGSRKLVVLLVPGPRSSFGTSWKNFSAASLRIPEDPPWLFGKNANVTLTLWLSGVWLAEEIGLTPSNLNQFFPKFQNLVPGNRVGYVVTMVPDMAVYPDISQVVALENKEVQLIKALVER